MLASAWTVWRQRITWARVHFERSSGWAVREGAVVGEGWRARVSTVLAPTSGVPGVLRGLLQS